MTIPKLLNSRQELHVAFGNIESLQSLHSFAKFECSIIAGIGVCDNQQTTIDFLLLAFEAVRCL